MFFKGFCKIAEESTWKDKAKKALLPVGAAAATYAAMRHPSSAAHLPKELRKMRMVAAKHGLTRVHLHDKKPGFFKKHYTELLNPADKHVHISGSYTPGKKTHALVFDPDDTKHFRRNDRTLGWKDKTTRQIEKGKMSEYKATKKMGLNLPKTRKFTSKRNVTKHDIVKPDTGSQARVTIGKEDFNAHDPKHALLKNFKAVKAHADKALKKGHISPDVHAVMLNKHPGWKRHMTEQAIKKPSKFVKQKKINIEHEYRVHAFKGQPLGVTYPRNPLQLGAYAGRGKAEEAVRKHLKKVHPDLKRNMLAMDVAKDKRGKFHVIETNPGADSGMLTTEHAHGAAATHKLYRQVTGRQSKPVAALAATGAAGATVGARHLLTRKKEPEGS